MAIGVYEHTQSAASSTWTVNHNLGVKPTFDALVNHTTSSGTVLTKILPMSSEHVSDNTLVLTFSSAVTGKVRLVGGIAPFKLKTDWSLPSAP